MVVCTNHTSVYLQNKILSIVQKHISKTIAFKFINRFTKQPILIVTMPYIPFKATNGYYSNLYKRLKEAACFRCEKSLIKGSVFYTTEKKKETIIMLNSGIGIQMPHDVTKKDVSIIKHYIEGLKMSITN